jgi:hypothetical protein
MMNEPRMLIGVVAGAFGAFTKGAISTRETPLIFWRRVIHMFASDGD